MDPASADFALHVVKNSYDHAACTRPGLPPSEENVMDENVTFVLSESMGKGSVTKLACWRSNFELETAILFEQQKDISVAADGSFELRVINGDYWTISTVRTATHGSFPTPVPPSQPRAPSTTFDNFDHDGAVLSQQPKGWMSMLGAWEIQLDAANTSNKVLRQMAPQTPLTTWRGSVSATPGIVTGMREWYDVNVSASFRLPTRAAAPWWPIANASACVSTRADWIFDSGVNLCVAANGQWNLSYGVKIAPHQAVTAVATGFVVAPRLGTWHTLSLTTVKGSATATYDGLHLFTNLAIRDVDTGFAALNVPGYYATEFDNIAVAPVGPDWIVTPTPPSGCPPKGSSAKAGQRIFARKCQPNGITADDEAFALVAQSWHIRHIASNLCVTAASGVVGAALTLEACNFTSPLQAWQNDYSNIHHQEEPLTLAKFNISLSAGVDGTATTALPGSDVRSKTWTKWTYMDSTHQLRNTRNPRTVESGGWGYPMCLSLCQDDA